MAWMDGLFFDPDRLSLERPSPSASHFANEAFSPKSYRAGNPIMSVRYLIALLVVIPNVAAADAPLTGADLVAACETALRRDFKGMEAAMCEWYVPPCGVCGVGKAPPAYCLPPGLGTRELAPGVIRDLRAQEPLLARPVKEAVERVLTARYPCHR